MLNGINYNVKKYRGNEMEKDIRDLILNVLENEGYMCELTKEGIIFVDDEDVDKTVSIHLQIAN